MNNMKKMKKPEYPLYEGRKEFSSIRELLEQTFSSFPNNEGCAYIEDNVVVSKTYREIRDDVLRIGSYLVNKCGYCNGKVGFISDSTYEWFISYLAALYYGVVVVPLDKQLSSKELAEQIKFVDLQILFFDDKQCGKIKQIQSLLPSEIEFICYKTQLNFKSYADIKSSQKVINELHPIKDDDLAEIVFTSGTTGISKGVMISHFNIASALMFATTIIDAKDSDKIISFLPNNHLYFLSIGLLLPICFGATLCLNDSIIKYKQNLIVFHPTHTFMVPALLQLLKRDITSQIKEEGLQILSQGNSEESIELKKKIRDTIGGNIEAVYCGGAFLDEDTIQFYKFIGIELLQGYGISECAPLVSCVPQHRVDYSKPTTVGLVGTCCDVKIIDDEICVKGPNVMLGYYKNPELTKTVMNGEWFKTGDIGSVDDEGYLYISGRKKNLIILSNGENVCPEEIENKIYFIEEVENVIVYSQGETIVAEIYPNKKNVEKNHIEDVYSYMKEQIAIINEELASYKKVRKVILRDNPFELTSTMKIKR